MGFPKGATSFGVMYSVSFQQEPHICVVARCVLERQRYAEYRGKTQLGSPHRKLSNWTKLREEER